MTIVFFGSLNRELLNVASFRDHSGKTWKINFDVIVLDEVRQETGVDLVDLSAGGFSEVDRDVIKIAKVVTVLCRDQLKESGVDERAFMRSLKGNDFALAFEALLKAAENFFPKKLWSEILSRLKEMQTTNAEVMEMAPGLAAMKYLPESMQAAAMEAMADQMHASVSSSSVERPIAGGPEETPSTHAGNSQESAELSPTV